MRVFLCAVGALVLATGPTVGDVGSCGVEATELELGRFARARKRLDCERCAECGVRTARCTRACDPQAPPDAKWPSTCHPLFHDGEVCVRALRAASCADFGGFVDDVAPTTPTECEFCRDVAPPSERSSDAGGA